MGGCYTRVNPWRSLDPPPGLHLFVFQMDRYYYTPFRPNVQALFDVFLHFFCGAPPPCRGNAAEMEKIGDQGRGMRGNAGDFLLLFSEYIVFGIYFLFYKYIMFYCVIL